MRYLNRHGPGGASTGRASTVDARLRHLFLRCPSQTLVSQMPVSDTCFSDAAQTLVSQVPVSAVTPRRESRRGCPADRASTVRRDPRPESTVRRRDGDPRSGRNQKIYGHQVPFFLSFKRSHTGIHATGGRLPVGPPYAWLPVDPP